MASTGNNDGSLPTSVAGQSATAHPRPRAQEGRDRKGRVQRKRLHVLKNPNKLAFKGWVEEEEPWTISTCESYIEWCHIDKLFPLARHYSHRHTNKANLKFCESPAFTQRCIEVYQALYRNPFVERNEVNLFLARGVYAEVTLNKKVDWTTVKETNFCRRPANGIIPKGVLPFPNGGLGVTRSTPRNQALPEPTSAESEEDDNSDGTRLPRLPQVARQVAASIEAENVPIEVGESSQGPQNRSAPRSRRSFNRAERTAAAAVVLPPPNQASNLRSVYDFGEDDVATNATDDVMSLANALEMLKMKDAIINTLQFDLIKVRSMCDEKDIIISQQSAELQRHREKEQKTLNMENMDDAFVEKDPLHLDKVVGDLTSDVDHRCPTPKRIKRTSMLPSAFQVAATTSTLNETANLYGTQDSLSFPAVGQPSPSTKEKELLKDNRVLKTHLAEVMATLYHWKVACILTVDRSKQIATELAKVARNFNAHNPKRENGLTSWALLEDMFPEDMPMSKEAGPSQIDWMLNGWDYKNHMSCHDKVEDQTLLWKNIASFVKEAELCPICQNGFGPEGGWALGTCSHVYHPQCLITQCLIRRRCVLCSAPFHDRLYDMFNLTTYKPPSWEHNPSTTDERHLWGRDLVWSWRSAQHDQEKGAASTILNWETDPAEILEVAPRLMGRGVHNEGKRAFFFQCLGGYFDKHTSTFKWGPHPQGHRWNFEGERTADTDPNDLEQAVTQAMLDTHYGPVYQSQALDYLLEAHSPGTRRTLEALQDSNVLENILTADGPASRTRARRRLGIGESTINEHNGRIGTEDDPNVIS